MGQIIGRSFWPSLCAAKGGQVQRSVDRVGKSARDVHAIALAPMQGGLTHPANASLGDPLCGAERVKKKGLSDGSNNRAVIIEKTGMNK